MATSNQSGCFLKLSSPLISFDGTNIGNTRIFFDNDNQQLIFVHGSGAMGVTVKGHRHEQSYSFRLQDKGIISSIKFNPDLSILAIKRSSNSIEFLNFAPISPTSTGSAREISTISTIFLNHNDDEYSQAPKVKTAKINDFFWITEKEIVFVTETSIETYVVQAEKRILRLTKQYPLVAAKWQLFSREMNLIVVYDAISTNNSLFPFSFTRNLQQPMIKLPKFDADSPQTPNMRTSLTSSNNSLSTSRRLSELTSHDCLLAVVYGKSFFMVIRQVTRVPGQGSIEVVLYQIEDEQKPAQKRHILRLNLSGKCSVNVVDNLIIIHHISSKTSFVYDIEEKSTSQNDGFQTIHQPLLLNQTLQLMEINRTFQTASFLPTKPAVEFYAPHWIIFQPNVIIDMKAGYVWYLTINLDILTEIIKDRTLLTDILLRRPNGKAPIMSLLTNILHDAMNSVQANSNSTDEFRLHEFLDLWIDLLPRINEVYRKKLANRPLLDQKDISSIFNYFSMSIPITPLNSVLNSDHTSSLVSCDVTYSEDIESRTVRFAINIVLEYIRSLNDNDISVEYSVFEVLVNLLLRNNQFFQLQQLIQYQILTDSVQLASHLLSASNKQQPMIQIALDMLKRLNNSKELILDILLESNFIIEALQYAIENLEINRNLARKLLGAALPIETEKIPLTAESKIIFYTVYKFFEEYFQKTAPSSNPLSISNNSNKANEEFEMFKNKFDFLFQTLEADSKSTN